MRIPTVHLNGTNGSDLMGQVQFASLAVEEAIEKLREAWPNGRDYYVQDDLPDSRTQLSGGNALREAEKEWQVRLDKLSEVHGELAHIAEGIAEQLDTRGP